MDSFSPVPATIGGLLIGLASALLWLGNGRIAGISGLFGQLLPAGRTAAWGAVFLLAMIGGALLAAYLLPGLGIGGPGGRPAELVVPPRWFSGGAPLWLAIAGLLVGLGTRIGNGCTSGHGVCGIARLSRRSFAAVGVFFAIAILTVAVTGIV